MKLNDFFKSDFVDYASYDNLRKIASCIDGQKNASRKVLYTLLEKNIVDKIKVSQLGSKVAEFAEYLHGNLDGVIVNLGQDFSGTNNIPLIEKKGNFGTRFTPEASASRYIFASASKEFFKLFKKEDCNILKNQVFEGEQIEPVFYLPSLPLILVNGSEGVSSGFAQKILSRNPKKIKNALIKYLNGEKVPSWQTPFFNDFNGTVEKGECENQWIIKGVIERVNKTKLLIKELPIGYDLKTYIKVLDKLEDSKIISSYKDLSNDSFKFEITMPSKDLDRFTEEELLNKLKLVKTISENYTCLNEENKIQEFKSVNEIFEYYINVKLKYLNNRKEFLLKSMNTNLDILKSKILFINAIIKGTLVINKKSIDKINCELEKIDGIIKVNNNYEYLLKMPLYTLTLEKLKKLKEDFNNLKDQIKSLNSKTNAQLWIDDLEYLKNI